jgi:hypothetical protein
MAVYVDDAFISAGVAHRGRQVTSRWCHMTADSSAELEAMARAIGLAPAWVQYKGTWKEHYDLTEPRRRKAVALGALEVAAKAHVRDFLMPRRKLEEKRKHVQD